MNQYRASYIKQCTCGTFHGMEIQEFQAQNDEEATQIVKECIARNNPEKNGKGVYLILRKLERIIQREESIEIKVPNNHSSL